MAGDDSAPIHERRKLVKTYKNVLPRKRTMVAKVCGETYSQKKMIKRWIRKTAIDVKYTPQTKGERWDREYTCYIYAARYAEGHILYVLELNLNDRELMYLSHR